MADSFDPVSAQDALESVARASTGFPSQSPHDSSHTRAGALRTRMETLLAESSDEEQRTLLTHALEALKVFVDGREKAKDQPV